VMVHAGLLPAWTVEEAEARARRAEAALRADPAAVLRALYADGGTKGPLEEALDTIRAMTRLRACTPDGRPDYRFNKTLEEMPAALTPWFAVPGRRSANATIVFGHWAALGFRTGDNFLALDSGCVWGHRLTAVRLEDGQAFQVPCG
jgi:bis(5'-nucleosyl)-tetraphosphatase (symmetrical)